MSDQRSTPLIRRARGNVLYLANGTRIVDFDLRNGSLAFGHRHRALLTSRNQHYRSGWFVPGQAEALVARYLASLGCTSVAAIFSFVPEFTPASFHELIKTSLNPPQPGTTLPPIYWNGWPIRAELKPATEITVSIPDAIAPIVAQAAVEGLALLQWMRRANQKPLGFVLDRGKVEIQHTQEPVNHILVEGKLQREIAWLPSAEEQLGWTRLSVPLFLEDGHLGKAQAVLRLLGIDSARAFSAASESQQ